MSKILLLGPYINSAYMGGVTVSFEEARRLLHDKVVSIDINHLNIGFIGLIANFLHIWTMTRCRKYDHISLHCTKNAFFVYGTYLCFLRLFFGTKYSIRKFAGSFDAYYERAGLIQKYFIKQILRNSDCNFFQTKALVHFFSKFNESTHFLPTSRVPVVSQTIRKYGGRFIFIGRVCRDKGIMELIRAFEKLEPAGYSLDVYGPLESGLELPELDRFYRGVLAPAEVQQTIAEYDMLILPSKWQFEGFPGVIIESFLAARPVIASNIGGIPELVESEVTGVLIGNVSTRTIIDAVLAVNDEKYQGMVSACIKHSTVYSAEFVYKNYVNAIEKSA